MNVIRTQDLKLKPAPELLSLAESLGLQNVSMLRKQDMLVSILKSFAMQGKTVRGGGTISVSRDGFGFLRSVESSFLPSSHDIYVDPRQIKEFALRTGDTLEGTLQPPREGENYFTLENVDTVNGQPPERAAHRVRFDSLTALYPQRRITLPIAGDTSRDHTLRVIDLVAPLGFGQRALVVAPPRTGKTVMMQNIAHALAKNHPDVHLIFLMVGERPEEVTDMARSVRGEVVGSTFDEPASRHVQVAEMVRARAERLAESGADVVILLDSITRLARAYNAVVPSSGKVLTGGVDANALQPAKRFFGAARAFDKGSLTIIGTALVDTGSRMDEVIFEEFKGTGNSEIVLDRKLADKRQFPAVDVIKSGTRKEEILVPEGHLRKMWVLRRLLSQMNTVEAMEFLLDKLRVTKDNDDFFTSMSSPN
jgi:transcription termination factor Rho